MGNTTYHVSNLSSLGWLSLPRCLLRRNGTQVEQGLNRPRELQVTQQKRCLAGRKPYPGPAHISLAWLKGHSRSQPRGGIPSILKVWRSEFLFRAPSIGPKCIDCPLQSRVTLALSRQRFDLFCASLRCCSAPLVNAIGNQPGARVPEACSRECMVYYRPVSGGYISQPVSPELFDTPTRG